MNMKINSRGSEWRKWDLHVHSLKTHLANGYGNNTTEDFLKKINDEEISVIGLTNYFNFVDEDFKLKTELEKKGVAVFLNLELRLPYQNKDKDCCDLHIIFENTVKKNNIENFLTKLNVDLPETKIITKNLAKETDFKKATIEFDHLLETLRDESLELSKKYLIGFLSRGKGNGRTITNYKKIVKESHFLLHSSDKRKNIIEDREFWLKKNKPLIQSSDAHKIDDIGKKFTWIKADPTFEGLKQILYEPKERVLIEDRNPSDPKAKRLIIDSAIYETSQNEKKTICFNKNLNTIIGVRGSGKSTLLKNLAQKIDQNEFCKRETREPYPLKNFEVIWGDGQKDGGMKESPKSIFYISQGYLSALVYDDGVRLKERDEFLTNLLKKNELFASAIQRFEDFVSNKKVNIEELIQKLISTNKSKKENIESLKKQGTKEEIEKEIRQKKEQIKKYKGTSITEKEVQNYSKSQEVVNQSTKEIGILKQDKSILLAIKKTGASISISDQKFESLSSTRQEFIQNQLEKKNKQNLQILIDEEILKIDTKIGKLDKTIIDEEKVIKKLEQKIKKSKVLKDLTTELTALNKTIDNIKKLTNNLEKAEKKIIATIEALVEAYDSFGSQQEAIYKTIEFNENFSSLKIKVVSKYNSMQFKTFVERNINTRDSYQNIKSNIKIKELFGDTPEQMSKKTVRDLIVALIDKKIKTKVDVEDVEDVLAQLLKNRFEIDYFKSVKTPDGITNFEDMTGGQKAIALLELIFRFDDEKYPILIDQPEDDLDVGGIASELVNFVTSEKQDRQIIMVTHNASLLICADTENVIVSKIESIENNKYDFHYATGSIENPDRRLNIIDFLEGGEDALSKRMLKLGIR